MEIATDDIVTLFMWPGVAGHAVLGLVRARKQTLPRSTFATAPDPIVLRKLASLHWMLKLVVPLARYHNEKNR